MKLLITAILKVKYLIILQPTFIHQHHFYNFTFFFLVLVLSSNLFNCIIYLLLLTYLIISVPPTFSILMFRDNLIFRTLYLFLSNYLFFCHWYTLSILIFRTSLLFLTTYILSTYLFIPTYFAMFLYYLFIPNDLYLQSIFLY